MCPSRARGTDPGPHSLSSDGAEAPLNTYLQSPLRPASPDLDGHKWHREFGNNVAFCQAYAHSGYAFYPTRLGPVAPGPGSELLPALYELANQAGMPFWSYFCVGTDYFTATLRRDWRVPGTTFLAPVLVLGVGLALVFIKRRRRKGRKRLAV